MTTIDQCPTKGKFEPGGAAPGAGGFWRSPEDFHGTPEFREFLEREFPAGASEADDTSRRAFLKVMGAGLALAGAATVPGCRRPERHIMPYSRQVPEQIVPGQALYYATSLCLPGGGAEGLLVETHTGRPTHIEGNPLHPINRGKSSIWSQACVLGLYDPDRLKYPVYTNPHRGPLAATWDDFKAWAGEHFAGFDRTGGAGLAFIADKKTSPTRDAMRDAVLARWPQARWVAWNPAEWSGSAEGTRLAFGRPMRVHHRLAKAQRVLSLDADFTHDGPEALVMARDFAATRVIHHAGDEMSRLYVAESRPTGTGSMADHRVRMRPSQIAALAAEVARLVMGAGGGDGAALARALPPGAALESEHAALAEHIAADLRDHGAGSVVIAGPAQPPEVHALACAINTALGSAGLLVTYSPMSDEEARDAAADLAALAGDFGSIDTVVCLNTNPVYDAPAALGLGGLFARVPHSVTLSVNPTETTAASSWALNGTHDLEQWGDAEAYDGTVSPVQPMIAPLYAPAMSEIELLAFLAGPDFGGSANPDGYELVTATWAARGRGRVDDPAFQKTWRRALHDGVLAGSARAGDRAALQWGALRQALAAMPAATGGEGLEITFHTGTVGDGRFANNAWLQELPHTGSSVVWDNPVWLSPATARDLGLLPPGADPDEVNPYTRAQLPKARLASLRVDGREMEVAVWAVPGMPDGVIAATLGYGRSVAGLVGDAVGHNTYLVKPAGRGLAFGATLTPTGGTRTIASTQNHWSMEDRTTIVRAMDKRWWDEHASHPPEPKDDAVYGTDRSGQRLNVAEKLGELSHTPEVVSIYENPQNRSRSEPDPGAQVRREGVNRVTGPDFAKPPQWGMTIDLNACSGCGACTIACQSENNIPTVGKTEVAKGREMHWIRVDRYFTGDLNNPDQMLMQPVACVHCENAPCETVCPVNATVHGPEGTNNMAYNRCIGTRYCANNCPYKVRRFNFFDWAQTKFRGGLDASYVGPGVRKAFEEGPGSDRTFNQNLIPPRLREKLDEISQMQRNPDVTVRGRGVMEKCTYCIQRINGARQEVKVNGMWDDPDQAVPIPDGFFQVACQQACPTDAIIFGDLLDPSSRVARSRETQRSYALLGYLATRPRTSYLMRVRNPNPAIGVYDDHDPLHHGAGHHGGGPGDEHHEGEHDGGHAFIDRFKQRTERGYALSLRVLGQATTGVQA